MVVLAYSSLEIFYLSTRQYIMKFHHKIADRFGYELIRKKRHPSASSHLSNVIKHYKINLVLDVGANVGQFAMRLRKNGYSGEIHSFEPGLDAYGKLCSNSQRDNLWVAHHLALGHETGKIDINVSQSSDLSSILNPNPFGLDRFEKIKVVKQEAVSITTIDLFAEEHIRDFENRRVLLKMDTQGFDLNVFRGAKKSVDNILCMQSEISFCPIYESMPNYTESLELYQNSGFAISGLYPVSRKGDMTVIEMDCIMINSRCCG